MSSSPARRQGASEGKCSQARRGNEVLNGDRFRFNFRQVLLKAFLLFSIRDGRIRFSTGTDGRVSPSDPSSETGTISSPLATALPAGPAVYWMMIRLLSSGVEVNSWITALNIAPAV